MRGVVRSPLLRPGMAAETDTPDSSPQDQRLIAPDGQPGERNYVWISLPFPRSLLENFCPERQSTVEHGQGPLLAPRSILEPMRDNPQIEQAKGISAQISNRWDFAFLFSAFQYLANEPQVLEPQLLRIEAQGTQAGSGL